MFVAVNKDNVCESRQVRFQGVDSTGVKLECNFQAHDSGGFFFLDSGVKCW